MPAMKPTGPDAIMRREGPVVGVRHRRDLAPLGQPAGPAEIRHHDAHRVAVEHVLVGEAAAERLAGADPDIGAAARYSASAWGEFMRIGSSYQVGS